MMTNTFRAVAGLAIAVALVGCDGGPTSPPGELDTERPVAEVSETATAVAPGDTDAALDAYAALEQEQIPMLIEASGGMFSDIEITAKYPNEMVYIYTYAEELPADLAAEYFDTMVDTLQLIGDEQLFPLMEQTGVTGIKKATYIYLNPDGTELWAHTFTSS